MINALVALVEFCRRRAILVLVLAVAATIGAGAFAARHLGIDTDASALLSHELSWRKDEAAYDKAFPQYVDLLAVVIDAKTPDQAEDATAALAARLSEDKAHFHSVRRPDGGAFFKRNGLLFLSVDEVQQTADQMIEAQPLIGALAADPSLRGLFAALSLVLTGVERGDATLDTVSKPLGEIADSIASLGAGRGQSLSWQALLTGRKPTAYELRRFILVQPKLDFDALQPGGVASAAIRKAASDLGLTAQNGVRVRLTGPVALSDEEFASVSEGAGWATALSFGLVCLLLFMALRSFRLVGAILITLVGGLVLTAGFAALTVGKLNMISVAFAVLYLGLAVDFGIQFGVRYRAERLNVDDLGAALRDAARRVGGPLALAGATTSVAFFSFLPTAYQGVSELGIIAGGGMLIAVALTLTVLPALLALLKLPGERAEVGYRWALPIDRFLVERSRAVLIVFALVGLVGLALSPLLRFDFDPLNLKDPKTESVSTLHDLMQNPATTPYTLSLILPSRAEAAVIAERMSALPEVERALTVNSYIPEQQDEKLATLADAAMLLGPTLTPLRVAAAPTDQEVLEVIGKITAQLRTVAIGRPQDDPANRLAKALDGVLAQGAPAVAPLSRVLIGGLSPRLDELRLALTASAVTFEDLPAELVRDWVAPDGRARVEIFPKIDTSTNQGVAAFVVAARSVAPEVTGGPVSIIESAITVIGAFKTSGLLALGGITLILIMALRRVLDVALVLLPLVLAGIMTMIASIALDMPINYANIIALPLLLGVGVAFDIYFVMNWRAGMTAPLSSPTARAVLFSAGTTGAAFGSLALAQHPGTADMGKLLALALFFTLVATLIFLPALLGRITPKK